MRLFALVMLAALLLTWVLGRHRALVRAELPVRALWLAPLALVLQVPLWRDWGGAGWQGGLFLLSYALMLLFCGFNWHLPGVRLFGVGLLLNLLVVVANGGFMPITPEAMARLHPGTVPADWPPGLLRSGSKDIVLPAQQTRLHFLSDVLVLPPPFPLPTAFSPGDVLIAVGFATLVWRLSAGTELKTSSRPRRLDEVGNALQ